MSIETANYGLSSPHTAPEPNIRENEKQVRDREVACALQTLFARTAARLAVREFHRKLEEHVIAKVLYSRLPHPVIYACRLLTLYLSEPAPAQNVFLIRLHRLPIPRPPLSQPASTWRWRCRCRRPSSDLPLAKWIERVSTNIQTEERAETAAYAPVYARRAGHLSLAFATLLGAIAQTHDLLYYGWNKPVWIAARGTCYDGRGSDRFYPHAVGDLLASIHHSIGERFDPATYVVAFIYLNRFTTFNPEFRIRSSNVHRLALISLRLADKFWNEACYANETFARAVGLSLLEFNRLEVNFLLDTRGHLFASRSDLEDMETTMVKHLALLQPKGVTMTDYSKGPSPFSPSKK